MVIKVNITEHGYSVLSTPQKVGLQLSNVMRTLSHAFSGLLGLPLFQQAGDKRLLLAGP